MHSGIDELAIRTQVSGKLLISPFIHWLRTTRFAPELVGNCLLMYIDVPAVPNHSAVVTVGGKGFLLAPFGGFPLFFAQFDEDSSKEQDLRKTRASVRACV